MTCINDMSRCSAGMEVPPAPIDGGAGGALCCPVERCCDLGR